LNKRIKDDFSASPPAVWPAQCWCLLLCTSGSAESDRLAFPPDAFMLIKAGLAFSQVPYELLILFLPHVPGHRGSSEPSGHSVPAKTWQQGCHLFVQMMNFVLPFT